MTINFLVKSIFVLLRSFLRTIILVSCSPTEDISVVVKQKFCDRLSVVRDLKAHELKSYFKSNESQLKSLAQTVAVWDTAEKLKLYGLLSGGFKNT